MSLAGLFGSPETQWAAVRIHLWKVFWRHISYYVCDDGDGDGDPPLESFLEA